MSDQPPHERAAPPDPPEGEVLSAYLAGDLDEDAAAALEQRLAGDRALARRLDATATLLTALRGVDEVALPPDAGGRLRDRLAAEPDPDQAAAPDAGGRLRDRLAAEPDPDRGPPDAATSTVTALSSRRRPPWSALGGVAAGLAAIALIAGGLLQVGPSGPDTVVSDGAQADRAVPEALEAPAFDDADGDVRGHALDDEQEAAPPVPPARQQVDGPVILDEEVRLEGPAEARARYAGLPEVVGLLGEPVPAAAERSVVYRAAVAEAPAFRSGARPGGCLDEVPGEGPVIPARVESLVYEGRPAVAFVLVGAGGGSPTLDRAEVWIVDPTDCAELLALELS